MLVSNPGRLPQRGMSETLGATLWVQLSTVSARKGMKEAGGGAAALLIETDDGVERFPQ